METKYSPTECGLCSHAYTMNDGNGYYDRKCRLTKKSADYFLESDGICPNFKHVKDS